MTSERFALKRALVEQDAGPFTSQVPRTPDNIGKVIALLDATYDMPRGSFHPCLWADRIPDAEYAFRLWAGAHQFRLEDSLSKSNLSGLTIRRLEIFDDSEYRLIAALQWPVVKGPTAQAEPDLEHVGGVH